MFFYRYDRGPRGRMYGHGGRRGLIVLGILALIGFAPIALAVLSGLCIGGIAVFGGLLTAVIEILTELGSGAFTAEGVAVGVAIGLILSNRNRKGASAARKEAENTGEAENGPQPAEEYYPTENYRSNGVC